MTTYIDSRLLAATQVHKIRNDVAAEVPIATGLLVLFSVAFGLIRGDGRDGVLFGAVVLVAVSVQLPLLLWTGANLTPTELEIHGLRRRSIRWHEIQLLTAERSWRTVRIVVWTVRGERIVLRAPTITAWGSNRQRFARDYRTIERYWLAYRGPYWQPAALRTPRDFQL